MPPANPKPRRPSGPSGQHARAGVLLREGRDGQLATWTAAAERAGLSLTAWIRAVLDRAARRR